MDQTHKVTDLAAGPFPKRRRRPDLSRARQSAILSWQRLQDFIASHAKLASVLGLSLFFIILSIAYICLSLTDLRNSDDASFALAANDILNGNILLHGWTLAPDNFYPTLIPLYAIANIVTHSLLLPLHVVPSVIYALLVTLCLATAWSLSEVPNRLIGSLIVLSVVGLGPPALDIGSVGHASTVLLILLSFYLLNSNSSLVLACVPLTLADAADPFALWVGTLPIALVGLKQLTGREGRGPGLIILAAASLLLSRLLLTGLHLVGGFDLAPLAIQFAPLSRFTNNLYLLCESVLGLFGANFFGRPVLGLATGIVLVHLIVMLFVIWMICRQAGSAVCGSQSMIMTLLVTALAVNVAAFVFSTAPIDESAARYLPTLPIFGALICALSWHQAGIDKKQILRAAPLVVAAYVLAFGARMVRPAANMSGPRSVIQFLEGNGLTEGYGAYWSAGFLTVLSEGKVVVRQVVRGAYGRLVPFQWVSAKQWYETGKARFVIYNIDPERERQNLGVDFRAATRTWGRPDRVLDMDAYRILIWRSPLFGSGGQGAPAKSTGG